MAILLALALGLFASPDLYEQGSALFRSGRFAEAAAVFEKAVNASPKDARLWKAVGASYAAMADYERANEPFSRACSLDPSLEVAELERLHDPVLGLEDGDAEDRLQPARAQRPVAADHQPRAASLWRAAQRLGGRRRTGVSV